MRYAYISNTSQHLQPGCIVVQHKPSHVVQGETSHDRHALTIDDWRLTIDDWRLTIDDWRLTIDDALMKKKIDDQKQPWRYQIDDFLTIDDWWEKKN